MRKTDKPCWSLDDDESQWEWNCWSFYQAAKRECDRKWVCVRVCLPLCVCLPAYVWVRKWSIRDNEKREGKRESKDQRATKTEMNERMNRKWEEHHRAYLSTNIGGQIPAAFSFCCFFCHPQCQNRSYQFNCNCSPYSYLFAADRFALGEMFGERQRNAVLPRAIRQVKSQSFSGLFLFVSLHIFRPESPHCTQTISIISNRLLLN